VCVCVCVRVPIRDICQAADISSYKSRHAWVVR